MKLRLAATVLIASAFGFTGCGPSAEDEAATAQVNEAACADAMVAFDAAQEAIFRGADLNDIPVVEQAAADLSEAAESAQGETQEVINRASTALARWAEGGLSLTEENTLPLSVDFPMFKLDAVCSTEE